MEVFMNDFSVGGCSFDDGLINLTRCLKKFEEVDLVLNWEKCHFMVQECIVLGHKISHERIEVDRAKVDVIEKLLPPKNLKGVRSFLGHAGFYRRFIKDFYKIVKPLTTLLQKESDFVFDDACLDAFCRLKNALISAPIVQAPDWSLPFELMYHSAIKYLISKNHSKPRLIRWVLALQDFFIEVKDKKGTKNSVADHFSRLEIRDEDVDKLSVNNELKDDVLYDIQAKSLPWYADIVNYLSCEEISPDFTPQQ
ncbi:uncharacterized protein LOC110695382 [Chenopodium quinoa]|uniref:uncharacterized protein LOC110695382 n=1 Tax=Chenopodium quinoa TaxID=63459 RepID=UPI000B78030D|nr:uncharacterized protein LOC110695382 [Chenopodium quinoa]